MSEQQNINSSVEPIDGIPVETPSIADLFLEASRELAQSDARIYRSVGRHIARTKEILRQAEAGADLPLLSETAGQLPGVPPSYDRQTRKSLESLCKVNGISGYSRLTKTEMISRLRANGVPAPPVPMEALTKPELITLLQQTLNHRSNNAQ